MIKEGAKLKSFILNGTRHDCADNIVLNRVMDISKKKLVVFMNSVYFLAEVADKKIKLAPFEMNEKINDCIQLIDKSYHYFFEDVRIPYDEYSCRFISIYDAYEEFIEHGTAERFHKCILRFLYKHHCIKSENMGPTESKGLGILINDFKCKTGFVLISDNGTLRNGKLVFRDPLSKDMFYKIFLITFYNLLEENGVFHPGLNNLLEEDLLVNKIKDDFTNDYFFQNNIVNVYENITKNCVSHKGHKFVMKKVLVEDLFDHTKYYIYMDQCENCKQYFVHYKDVDSKIKDWKHPKLKYNPATKPGFGYTGQENKYSVLTLYGYNVKQYPNHSAYTRHIILCSIIEGGIISANDVIGHLDYLISKYINKPKMEDAVQKWISDREYIEENFY